MSFGLGRERDLDDAPGVIGVLREELPALPDDLMTNREGGRVDPRRWFVNPALPLEIEIGCGKGTFLVNQAPQARDVNYLGIEWAKEFYLYTADRLRRLAGVEGLTNVRMLHADATEFLKWRCPSAIVRVIHLYFSDPWPKKKHHKNRVIQDSFLAEVARVLLPGGELRVVTDHDELWEWDKEHFARWSSAEGEKTGDGARPFVMLPFTPPDWVEEGELVGTNYERKFRTDERPAHACTLRRMIHA